MAKGVGIAGLVLAIFSAFAVYGFNFAAIWFSMGCCIAAILNGERVYSIASMVVALVGLLLFSPITMAAVLLQVGLGSLGLPFIAFFPFLAAAGALIYDSSRVTPAAAPGDPPL